MYESLCTLSPCCNLHLHLLMGVWVIFILSKDLLDFDLTISVDLGLVQLMAMAKEEEDLYWVLEKEGGGAVASNGK